MVKRYMPRYNILLRDDKSQLFVRIDMKSEWPYVATTRNPADDGATYIGPFYNGYAVKKALRYLRKVFPYYTKAPAGGRAQPRRNHPSKIDTGWATPPGLLWYRAQLRTTASAAFYLEHRDRNSNYTTHTHLESLGW